MSCFATAHFFALKNRPPRDILYIVYKISGGEDYDGSINV